MTILPFPNRKMDWRLQLTVLKQFHEELVRLTPREHEVFRLLCLGQTNKQVAAELSVSPRTIEVHRRNILFKVREPSITLAVAMAAQVSLLFALHDKDWLAMVEYNTEHV